MNKFKITRREYNAKSTDYRGTVAGKPYLVYMDDNGGTVYGPVEMDDLPLAVEIGVDDDDRFFRAHLHHELARLELLFGRQ